MDWANDMNEEQMQRAIEFLIQSQADSATRNAIIEENFHNIQTDFNRIQAKLDSLTDTVRGLAEPGRNLVEVAQIHARRLDRIEGIQPDAI
jgi:hypothetical protein